MSNMEIYTMGVYGSSEDSFFKLLIDNEIDAFCDIRQRRGVRGSQYSYVNSNYLQEKLSVMNIRYYYEKLLAPTNEIRQKQKDDDKQKHIDKKQRTELGLVFKSEYIKQILDNYDIDALIDRFVKEGVKKVVFFCVEQNALACHRSLVALRIAKKIDKIVVHL